MPREIIRSFENRQHFLETLKVNPGLIIIKFGAEWCGPCKQIENFVHEKFSSLPENVQPVLIDVDDSIDGTLVFDDLPSSNTDINKNNDIPDEVFN